MKTIAQQINWDFKTNGNLEVENKNGKRIYWENSDGYWEKWEYDWQGNEIYFESSDGVWIKKEWNSQGKRIYYESSSGFWVKREYDSRGNEIYFEDSKGIIRDNRPKSCEDKVVEIEGEKYKLVKQ